MSITITLTQRVNTLDYQHYDVSITRTFEDNVSFDLAKEMTENNLDELLVDRMKDLKSLNVSDERKKNYFAILEAFYQMPKKERREL